MTALRRWVNRADVVEENAHERPVEHISTNTARDKRSASEFPTIFTVQNKFINFTDEVRPIELRRDFINRGIQWGMHPKTH